MWHSWAQPYFPVGPGSKNYVLLRYNCCAGAEEGRWLIAGRWPGFKFKAPPEGIDVLEWVVCKQGEGKSGAARGL